MKGLASVMQTELKQKGEGMIPGVCRLKVEKKPAMKAKKGKTGTVKASPAMKIVKAFPVADLTKSI